MDEGYAALLSSHESRRMLEPLEHGYGGLDLDLRLQRFKMLKIQIVVPRLVLAS